jgi:hypothetical protein
MSLEGRTVGESVRRYVETTHRALLVEVPERLANESEYSEEEVEQALDWMISEGLLYVFESKGDTVVKVV